MVFLSMSLLEVMLESFHMKFMEKYIMFFKIDRSRLGEDLKEALKCQRTFAEVVYA